MFVCPREMHSPGAPSDAVLLLVFFFLFVVFFVVLRIAFVGNVLFAFLVVFFIIHVVGNEVEMDGMRLRYFELGFAFRATQDFAFFDFVFIDIDFGGTFRAADHGTVLRRKFPRWARIRAAPPSAYYIPRCRKSTVGERAATASVTCYSFRIQAMTSSREYPERP